MYYDGIFAHFYRMHHQPITVELLCNSIFILTTLRFLQLFVLLCVRMVLVLLPIIVAVLWDSRVKRATLLSCQNVTSIHVKMVEPALLSLALTFVTVHLSLLASTV